MTELSDWLRVSFLSNTILQWGLALLAFLVTFTVLPLVRGYLASLRKRYAGSTHAVPLELSSLLAAKTRLWFLWAVAFWVAETTLKVEPAIDTWFGRVLLVLLALQIGIWASAAVGFLLQHRRGSTLDTDPTGALAIVNFVAAIAIWALVALLVLDNLGVNITALVAGLGIGGIAVALAVQAVLGNLLASLSIALDKPFVVGDVITVDQDTGRVEKIGISNTRLRSINGEQIIIANADLLKARLHNFGRMYERRVVLTIGVSLDTPRAKLEQVPRLIEAAVRAQPKTRFERSHLIGYGTSALMFETVYFVLDADYLLHADILQAINLQILERFEGLQVELALPTQRVLSAQDDAQGTEATNGSPAPGS